MKEVIRIFSSVWLENVDSKRYALLRIGFAALLLVHFIHLWPYRITILTNEGIASSEAAAAGFHQLTGGTSLSVFSFLKTPALITFSFAFTILATFFLACGKWARPALAICFWFQLSLIHRAPLSTTGWDSILTNVGFILLFCPLGNRWNPRNLFTNWHKKTADHNAPRYGLVLVQIQVFIIYWQTVIQKLADHYWAQGEFITYFLLSHHGRFPGLWPLAWHDFLDKINYLTLLIELAIPVLLWIPKTTRLGFALGVGFHLSIAILGINLSLFSLTMIVTYFAFLDPWKTLKTLGAEPENSALSK